MSKLRRTPASKSEKCEMPGLFISLSLATAESSNAVCPVASERSNQQKPCASQIHTFNSKQLPAIRQNSPLSILAPRLFSQTQSALTPDLLRCLSVSPQTLTHSLASHAPGNGLLSSYNAQAARNPPPLSTQTEIP